MSDPNRQCCKCGYWATAAQSVSVYSPDESYLDWALVACSMRFDGEGRCVEESDEDWAFTDVLFPLRNVILGVSVEDQASADVRIPLLLGTRAACRMVSYEPALGPVFFDQFLSRRLDRGLDWLVCGGESGPGARRMDPYWARSARDACVAAGVSFFFKQWGEFDDNGKRVGKKASGRLLDGHEYNEVPGAPAPRTEMGIELDGETVRNYPTPRVNT